MMKNMLYRPHLVWEKVRKKKKHVLGNVIFRQNRQEFQVTALSVSIVMLKSFDNFVYPEHKQNR
jgi:hypothetical protein